MYQKLLREVEEIRNNAGYYTPQEILNTAANLLADGELVTGEYLAIAEAVAKLPTVQN